MLLKNVLVSFALFVLVLASSACTSMGAEEDEDGDSAQLFERSAALASRSFQCGYALPGYGCNNGRRSVFISASSLTEATAACPSFRPAGYSDSCYTLAVDGGNASDPSECAARGGSWRPGNSCCNFNGSLSCPVTRNYTCGYALPGYGCNNGRNHAFIVAAGMSAAIAACPAARPSGYTDNCYVIDATGGTAADSVSCAAAGGSWRPGNSCCNFNGSLSCP